MTNELVVWLGHPSVYIYIYVSGICISVQFGLMVFVKDLTAVTMIMKMTLMMMIVTTIVTLMRTKRTLAILTR